MLLTLYYMYATFVQWWRLTALRQKLNGTLNKQNALLLCSSTQCIGHSDSTCVTKPQQRSLENLLYQYDGRIACTIVPRQKLHLGQWAAFPKDRKAFPIHYGSTSSSARSNAKSTSAKFHLLLQASLENCLPAKIDIIKMEKFGELVAWRAHEHFEVVLKTDLEKVTILLNSFRFHLMGVNHDLPLIKIETVDVDGAPGKIKFDRRPMKLKFSAGPGQFQQFATHLRQLFAKVNESLNPKITIENGNSLMAKGEERKPISEVKPIKKQTSKNTLEVHHGGSSHKKTKTKTIETKVETNVNAKSKEEVEVVKDIKETTKEVEKEKKSKDKEKEVVKSKKNEENVEEKENVTLKTKEKATKSDEKLVTKEKIPEKTKTKEEKSKETEVKEAVVVDKDKKKGKTSKKLKETKEKGKSEQADPPKATLNVVKKTYSDVAAASTGKNLQRQNATSTSKETSPNRAAKPPNILVYADTSLAKENVKAVLKSIINKDKYTVYDFPTSNAAAATGEPLWNASTTLVVVCGAVPPSLTPHLIEYLVGGGQLLCLCSDLLYSVLQPFSTAEVREHELVRFTYGEWKRVKMMHHIFCYQASPAKKQFSRDSSDQSMNGGGPTCSSPVPPRTPSIVDIVHAGRKYTIQVQVLGAEETWQTPSLLLASAGAGKAIFSQVHLEVDPTQYQDDECKYAALKDSNRARLEIMKHILAHHLDVDCSGNPLQGEMTYGPAYFLGRHDLKLKLLNENNDFKYANLELRFIRENVEPPEASATYLPIMVLRCPSHFSTVEYFDNLSAERIGRLVIYADVLASSQNVLQGKLCDGLAVIPRRQTAGKGRAGNVWLSPEGCAMFSLQLHVPLDSHLGRSLSLVQHLVMVAVVKAVKKLTFEKLEVGLKWPNDLYAYGNIKIGGLIATSLVEREIAVVNVGCGINLDNREPTICINDMVKDIDKEKCLSPEKFFAGTFNEVELLINNVQETGIDALLDLYYQYWLHSNANISVTTSDGKTENVTIRGVDTYGFLQVEDENGQLSSVQSDGNTFDMLRGLIVPKMSS